jgi:putative Mn2+ efflux pump MntP
MDFITNIVIAIGLAMDAFAVSLGVGTSRSACDKRSIFRLSFHFGLFQGLMTFLGWLAGSTISTWIENYDHWIAFVLLAFVGIHMIGS